MLIKKVVLENIRSYSNQEVEFPAGSVLLSGDIGSGKSSLLFAVEFALFGSDNDRISGNALLRKGATSGAVTLTFTVGGEEITIKRGLKQGKNSISQTPGYIVRNGLRKDAMPVELKSEIISLLGYPSELATKRRNITFRYTVYCPQEEMKAILVDEQESRLDTLRKIFAIDKYQRIRDNAAIVTKRLRDKKREMEIRVEGLQSEKDQLDAHKGTLQYAHERLAALTPLIQQLEQEITANKVSVTKVEEEVKLLQENKKRFSLIEAEIKWKRDEIEKQDIKLQELHGKLSRMPVAGDVNSLSLNISQTEERIRNVLEQRRVLEEKLNNVKERINILDKEVAVDITSSINEKNDKLKQYGVELEKKAAYEGKIEESRTGLDKLRAVLQQYVVQQQQSGQLREKILKLAECPTCLQPVRKEHKEQVHRAEMDKMEFLDKKIQEYQQVVRQKEFEQNELQKVMQQFAEYEKQIAALNAEMSHLKIQNEQVEDKKKQLEVLKRNENEITSDLDVQRAISVEEQREKLSGLKEKFELVKENEVARKEVIDITHTQGKLSDDVDRLEREIIMLNSKIGESAAVERKLVSVRSALDQMVSEERKFSIERAELETQRNSVEKVITNLVKEIEDKEKLLVTISKVGELHNWLDEFFINLMQTIEKHVMLRIYHEFNALFKEWFGMLIEDDELNARVDDRFQPVIEQRGMEIPVGYLSGGERTSAALAYRLALNKVVNDVIQTIKTKELLILDEPTDGFSSEQLDRVREVLDQLGLEQVIIVSHEQKIESFVNHVITVVKVDGVSKIIK
jgi:DNA repair protein SbcC/Rad50